MAPEEEERPRVLGFRVGGRAGEPRAVDPGRVAGLPVHWFGPLDVEWFGAIAHPLRRWRRWRRHRRLGPYAVDDDSGNGAQGKGGPGRSAGGSSRRARLP